MPNGLKTFIVTVVVSVLSIAAVIAGVFAFDRFAAKPSDIAVGGNSGKRSIYSFQLRPYTGLHIQSNYKQGGLHTGDHGFYIDFPITHPPEKEPGEYRIILIGGSAAQGVFIPKNEDGLATQIERRLNERGGRPFKVINLAMSGCQTLQKLYRIEPVGAPHET